MVKSFGLKSIQVGAIAALLGVCMTANTVAAGKPTITVAVWSNWNFVQTAANAFMKHHNVSIQISAIPGDQYFDTLPRTLPNGGADVTVLEVTGTGSYQALVKEHALVNLGSIWNSLKLTKVTPPAVRS